MTRAVALRAGLAAFAFAALAVAAPVARAQQGVGNVVYVPTPQVVVDAMLKMGAVGPADRLIDLGSGDGRIVITAAKLGARATGVDLDRYLLGQAREAAQREGVAARANFLEQDLFQTDLTGATVVTTYLLPSMNLKLRPKILALPPGTRVLAHDYHMGDWIPDERATLDVPEKKVGSAGQSFLYMWVVPARVAGRWQSQLAPGDARGKPQAFDFELAQSFQYLDGSARLGAESGKLYALTLHGDVIRMNFASGADSSARAPLRHVFEGKIDGDRIDGTVTIGDGSRARKLPWRAMLVVRGAVPE